MPTPSISPLAVLALATLVACVSPNRERAPIVQQSPEAGAPLVDSGADADVAPSSDADAADTSWDTAESYDADGDAGSDAGCGDGQRLCGATCIASTACCSTTECARPGVAKVTPAAGLLANDAVITITFTKPMNQTVTSAAVTLTPALPFSSTWTNGGTVLELRPTGGIQPVASDQDPKLKLTVAASATDTFGVDLGQAVSVDYGRLRKFVDKECPLAKSATVSEGINGSVEANVLRAGTQSDSSPLTNDVQNRAFMEFGCSAVLQQAQTIVTARLVLTIQTTGSPSAPVVFIERIASTQQFGRNSFDATPTSGEFAVSVSSPATWNVDLSSVIKLTEAKSDTYTFRARTPMSFDQRSFTGYTLTGPGGAPKLLVDFLAP